jgi:hypothetical protein
MRRTKVCCVDCNKHAPLYDCDACGTQVQRCLRCSRQPCPNCGDESETPRRKKTR